MSLPMPHAWWHYALFILFVLVMLAVDLGVFHRRFHAVTHKEALIWSVVWITLALLFNVGVWYFEGPTKAGEFLAGYLIEKSLSLDNLFVFLMIFMYFGVPDRYQHRVLYWGILGALVMRGVMIAAGAALIARFHIVIYIFGAFLVYTGIRFMRQTGPSVSPETNPVLRLLRRLVPITPDFREEHFFVREGGKWLATPLFVVLVLVETSDVMFAVDSIPAIFAITYDPFIVFTSNVFAILGLRALYFLLANIMPMFRYLNVGLGTILAYVGVKMLLQDVVKIPVWVSLIVIAVVLGASLGYSVYESRRYSEEVEEQAKEDEQARQDAIAEDLEAKRDSDDR
ncbi:MAG TPA: TerC family protein [Candidatus Xenobia bacterium]|nr:TerC family protein [Candidatus Xenobia bacterium]